MLISELVTTLKTYDRHERDLAGNIDDACNVARVHFGLAPLARPQFSVPTVAREDRRRPPR